MAPQATQQVMTNAGGMLLATSRYGLRQSPDRGLWREALVMCLCSGGCKNHHSRRHHDAEQAAERRWRSKPSGSQWFIAE
jgi:hypothetical protein